MTRKTFTARFSALQRAEIAEMVHWRFSINDPSRFSALQRAEIAEIRIVVRYVSDRIEVSVLFNEPKLLKFYRRSEMRVRVWQFQCSSTSRNC